MTKRPIRTLLCTLLVMAGITVLVRLDKPDGIAMQFYYLPIIFAGFNFSIYGAIVVSFLSAYLSATHGTTGFENGTTWQPEDFQPLLQLAMFFVVGYFASAVAATLRRRALENQTLYDVAQSITSSLRLREVLDLIADHAMKVMNARSCGIRLLDKKSGELRPAAMKGFSDEYLQKGAVSREGSPLDQQVLRGEPVQIYDVRHDSHFQYPEAAQTEGLSSVLSAPLSSKNEALGVIRVYSRSRKKFRQREVNLLMAFAHQAAVAIENAELYEDIRRNYYETLRALATAVEARDSTTYNHSERVTELADRLADHLKLNGEMREQLRFGCILHDIGKIGIEESALEARDANDREQVFYKMHPLIGRSILQPVRFLETVLPVVTHHHENWNGSGFPEGLAGDKIPYAARLCAICDYYDRLRNPQCLTTNALSREAAVAEIVAGGGTLFDPQLAGEFQLFMDSRSISTPDNEEDADRL